MVYLASCGPSKKTYKLYTGPQLPSDKTAQLVCKDYHVTVSFSGRSMTTVFGNSYNYQVFYTHDSLHNVDITITAKAGHTYLVTSNHDYDKSAWNAVVRDETDDRRIFKEGPYPLNKIRTGDNQAAKRVYRK
jgi:hypothetical protein